MILKLTSEETQELKRALTQAHVELVQRLSDGMGCGYSAQNMALCARKARVERLLNRLDHAPGPVALTEPVKQELLVEAA